MFQQLLPLMPATSADHATTAVIVAICAGALAGTILWLAGSRYSRMVVTLATVTVGGVAGMLAPRIFGWNVNTQATALAGAMLFGLAGFICHGTCVTIALMSILSLWAVIGTWLACHGDTPIAWPADTKTTSEFLQAVWTQLPASVKGPMPISIAFASLLAIGIRFMLPRLATVLAYSLMGVTLVIAMSLWAIQSKAIQWPRFVPAQTNMQLALIGAMVLLGAIVQLQLGPKKKHPAPATE